MKFRFFQKKVGVSETEKEKQRLSGFVKQQFKELAKKRLSLPVTLYTL